MSAACSRSSAPSAPRADAAAAASAGATAASAESIARWYAGVGIFAAKVKPFWSTMRVRSDRSQHAFCVRTAAPFAAFCDLVRIKRFASASSARIAASSASNAEVSNAEAEVFFSPPYGSSSSSSSSSSS